MKITRRYISFGDIVTSKLWLCLEKVGFSTWALPSFGPTYNSTVAGVVWQLGRFVLIGHIR